MKFIVMDEEGFWSLDGLRVADEEWGRSLLKNIKIEGGRVETQWDGEQLVVEAFDAPLVALQTTAENGNWIANFAYGVQEPFSLQSLSLDEWDRFHGVTDNGWPFVMSRNAQNSFFNSLDEFGDDYITWRGTEIHIPSYFITNESARAPEFWEGHYSTQKLPWDMGEITPPIKEILPRLKLPRQRVAVLGAGGSHDAAYLAEQGHVVTCVDFSAEAIKNAQEKYGKLGNLTFVCADAFKLPRSMHQNFDLIVEHTFYCAVDPQQRNDVVRVWRQLLQPQGFLLGVFFTMPKRQGPPFGGSEWEIRKRLKNSFEPMYWQRCRNSIPKRMGMELLVYARKL